MDSPDIPLTCSAKGCAADAAWALRWNNPKIHTPDRRKAWLACEEHKASLTDFLGARGFLRETEPIADFVPETPASPAGA
ncbi:hypothetical protein GCM10011584_25510 [Nocardioides phosphati]|uniref:Acetone carboxylase n=1 Tax=Nocardioides phosphati TaxID=1867775 RepID=A0ABQ2ND48_9ACTN|nr:hypothetical protein [Nocardioides phosphati]GGO91438.1 hypothetical protein GCM10011584_25510 [Nocardioides phosphati]